MKKILVFNRSLFQLSETFIYRQVSGLEKNFHITLLCFKYLNSDNFPLIFSKAHQIFFFTSLVDRLATSVVRVIFRKSQPFSIRTTAFINTLLREEEIDLIHAHYGWNGIQMLDLAKKNRIRLVVSFHGRDASASLSNSKYKHRLPELFDYASAIIICSPHMQETLNLSKWSDKVHLVPYGIDVNNFMPFDKKDAINVKILHSGRITSKKGVPDLIRVFSKLRKRYDAIELHILGQGEESDQCVYLVNQLGISDSVVFYGAQPQTIVRQLMNEADIFVLNSRTDYQGDMEGLPNAILEAMSFEKAVVSTEHAGIPMVVKHKHNGWLVPEKDNDKLYLAMEQLILNKDLRLKLGRNARKTIVEQYQVEGMQSEIRRIFFDILSNIE